MLRRLLPLVAALPGLVGLVACSSPSEEVGDDSHAMTEASGACIAQPACRGTTEPALGPTRPFEIPTSEAIAVLPRDHHRGRDQVVLEGQDQWVIGKFAYGLTDKDLKGELVDIFVERGCAGGWEKLGTARTTLEDQHEPVEGVEDSGGRVYFKIPKEKQLPLGRHRIRLVVAGDHTYADMLIEVVTRETPMFVSDVDGTLTASELREFKALLDGELPDAQPDAAKVLTALAQRGYHPIYLTARPEWLTHRTEKFLRERGFPPGIIHTTTTITGVWGEAATAFKSAELKALNAKGLNIRWAFGNKESDDEAYRAASFGDFVRRIFLKVTSPHGGRKIDRYSELLAEVADEPTHCSADGPTH